MKKTAKNVVIFLVTFLLVLSMSSCGKTKGNGMGNGDGSCPNAGSRPECGECGGM